VSVFESMTPAERSLRARAAAHQGWANTKDRKARARPGAEAARRRFEAIVDPDGAMSEADRMKAAESAYRAWMADNARKSVKARKPKAAQRVGAETE
jgi:hypothetical protein